MQYFRRTLTLSNLHVSSAGYNYDKFIEDYVGTNEDGDAQKEEDNDTLPDKVRELEMSRFLHCSDFSKALVCVRLRECIIDVFSWR